MPDQTRGGKLAAFTRGADRCRVYTALAALAEAGIPLGEGLRRLAEAYGESTLRGELAPALSGAAEAVEGGVGPGTALLGAFQGLLPEERALLAAADVPVRAAAAISGAAALLALEANLASRGPGR